MFRFFVKKHNDTAKKKSKKVFSDGVNLEITAGNKQIIEQVKVDIENILKITNFDVKKMLEYVEIPVYIRQNASSVLKFFKEEGFLVEQFGLKALVLSIFTGCGIKFYTPAMFLLEPIEKVNKYFFLHEFYKYYSFKLGLPGYDSDIQNDLIKYFYGIKKMEKLSMEKIVLLKEAISRDNEATDFVLELKKKHDAQDEIKARLNSKKSEN